MSEHEHQWEQIADNGKVKKFMCMTCMEIREEKAEKPKPTLGMRLRKLIK